jgi:hypothetical protein
LRGKRGVDQLERRTVTIHLKTDNSFSGVLLAAYEDCLVLDKPVVLGEKPDLDAPLGGQAVFPLDNIDYFTTEKIEWRRS